MLQEDTIYNKRIKSTIKTPRAFKCDICSRRNAFSSFKKSSVIDQQVLYKNFYKFPQQIQRNIQKKHKKLLKKRECIFVLQPKNYIDSFIDQSN